MVHFLLKSVLPARERVNGTDQLLLLRVIELDIVQDRRRCIRNTEYREAVSGACQCWAGSRYRGHAPRPFGSMVFESGASRRPASVGGTWIPARPGRRLRLLMGVRPGLRVRPRPARRRLRERAADRAPGPGRPAVAAPVAAAAVRRQRALGGPFGPARQGSADAGAVLGRDYSPAAHRTARPAQMRCGASRGSPAA